MSINSDGLSFDRKAQVGKTHERVCGPPPGIIVVSGYDVKDGQCTVVLEPVYMIIQGIDALYD